MIDVICLSLGLQFATPASLTANDVMRRGEIITSDNTSPPDDIWQQEHADLLGREVSRTVYAGQTILAKDTRPMRLVKRNQLVTLKYVRGPLEITLTGRALGEAAQDEAVTVLNLESRQVVEGIVQAGGWIWVQ
ncbi:MAG: flagellar basal body P-ring formation chaperone FlgA [Pseudomonadota bacterium]